MLTDHKLASTIREGSLEKQHQKLLEKKKHKTRQEKRPPVYTHVQLLFMTIGNSVEMGEFQDVL